mmetsp:Transcript_3348/g.5657  ORF Transcript_3348/g.5657 Transcript_3348/m.5657 type:complete len:434 (+) Transcript_3348:276-1577(+)|eukprot:CAMPEP_0184530374 /NCGR_PEP_ID=MMETSP0198_2-20121128/12912_1 /TAXON_ID=1112570 /ORGANISM="Thraustochytrium sp., Strain LLF1b" /LENGTH=433 /DNA_ID=CAMNT_0026922525 /DNA_START=180 /DNA_END=1481 /DNA_ORIENTATION=+
MPKAKRKVKVGKTKRMDPLDVQISKDEEKKYAATRKFKRVKTTRKEQEDEEALEREGLVPSNVSRKILSFAREQLEEEKDEQRRMERAADKRQAAESDDELDDEFDEKEDEHEFNYQHEDHLADLHVQADDERALEAFMNKNKPERRTLADIIMEKIREKEEAAANGGNGSGSAKNHSDELGPGLNPQLIAVYQSIGKLLTRYRAGKIPKAFKIIPALRNWEEVLYHTNPDKWSPQAMRAATRLFASNLNQKMAQRFYALVLLPAVRDDIIGNKKLNYHLYMALKKSLYRPGAFFKGILLPLCEEGDCTLREAAIIGSVLSKVSIPMMHSAAAMLKMAAMPYNGSTSLFLRVLLNKKYSLPYKVVDSLLRHFVAFRKERRVLPVLWHQSLLVFAQRYKTTLTVEQKEFIKPLIKQHFHHQITPEIRRELFHKL